MAIGPVQLIALGFQHPNFHGEVIAELERLRESDTVRVIDALAVYKSADGELEAEHLSNLSEEEAIELGSKIGALIGLGFEGEEGIMAGAEAGAEAVAEQGGIKALSDEDGWDVLEDIPNDSAAALILLEHHWAVRCATPSHAPAGSGSATASSAHWTSSRSGWSRPRKPRNCTRWKPRPPPADRATQVRFHTGRRKYRCLDHAGSHAEPGAVPRGASPAAAGSSS
jgi:uncharacterized membrane protein